MKAVEVYTAADGTGFVGEFTLWGEVMWNTDRFSVWSTAKGSWVRLWAPR